MIRNEKTRLGMLVNIILVIAFALFCIFTFIFFNLILLSLIHHILFNQSDIAVNLYSINYINSMNSMNSINDYNELNNFITFVIFIVFFSVFLLGYTLIHYKSIRKFWRARYDFLKFVYNNFFKIIISLFIYILRNEFCICVLPGEIADIPELPEILFRGRGTPSDYTYEECTYFLFDYNFYEKYYIKDFPLTDEEGYYLYDLNGKKRF
jgi:hypothetical protein